MFNHELLRKKRLEAGMTQEEVAKKAGIYSRSWYYGVESGNNVPNTKHIIMFAKIFQVPVEEFIKEDTAEGNEKEEQ